MNTFYAWFIQQDPELIGLVPLTIALTMMAGVTYQMYHKLTSVKILVTIQGLVHKGGSPACWSTEVLKTASGDCPTLYFKLRKRREFWLVVKDSVRGTYFTNKEPGRGVQCYKFEMLRGAKEITPVMDDRPYILRTIANHGPVDTEVMFCYKTESLDYQYPHRGNGQ